MASMIMIGSYSTTTRIAKSYFPCGICFSKVAIDRRPGPLSIHGLNSRHMCTRAHGKLGLFNSRHQWKAGVTPCHGHAGHGHPGPLLVLYEATGPPTLTLSPTCTQRYNLLAASWRILRQPVGYSKSYTMRSSMRRNRAWTHTWPWPWHDGRKVPNAKAQSRFSKLWLGCVCSTGMLYSPMDTPKIPSYLPAAWLISQVTSLCVLYVQRNTNIKHLDVQVAERRAMRRRGKKETPEGKRRDRTDKGRRGTDRQSYINLPII